MSSRSSIFILLQQFLGFFSNFLGRTPGHGTGGPGCTSATASRHGVSPALVRGKTEPSHHSLSFPPNFKPSRALNHRQSDLQEASVCQPCPSAMEVSRGIIFVGPQLLIFGRKIGNYWRWTLFCLLISIWGVSKQQLLKKNIRNS